MFGITIFYTTFNFINFIKSYRHHLFEQIPFKKTGASSLMNCLVTNFEQTLIPHLMDNHASQNLLHFKNYVALKFQLYNSLFTSLPFHRIEKTGILLSLFINNCEEGYRKKLSPTAIIDDFFSKQNAFASQSEKLDLLFRFVQFIERQVVLFDALEDAAFAKVYDTAGAGTLKQLEMQVLNYKKEVD